jgi:hypothetical protein
MTVSRISHSLQFNMASITSSQSAVSSGTGSQRHSCRVPRRLSSLAGAYLTRTLHGRNPWPLSASVHHWLVPTACRPTHNLDCLKARIISRYIASGRTQQRTPPTTSVAACVTAATLTWRLLWRNLATTVSAGSTILV